MDLNTMLLYQLFLFFIEEDGASAVEYGIIASLIAGAVVFAAKSLGLNVIPLFERVVFP
jgi:Flp pilus assembly pilin Flp